MNSKGVTLVELMVALAVFAILVAVAVPAFRSLLQEQRRQVIVNELVATLKMARTEAVSRHTPIVVRASGEGWSGGWVVMPDMRGLYGGTPPVLRKYVLDGTIRIEGNHWVRKEVRFNSLGAVAGVGGAGNPGTFYVCDANDKARARLIISWVGRLRVDKSYVRNRDDECRKSLR
ncbi:GspH/FimT family pseudopilin [Pseudomonas rhizosphaerae]|jgi:type IV fimbrial biogenesis protein FimT|uniref:GspH/FimT family pseudopilin n=1 Tax=Pseudomonas rhizosphaerae TaxID=216142 RepID=UPI0017831AA0|nr:GspH/FimT family pseudopilin [Pseudomonas rhizosphaerae]MBD8616402.1 GspH/FimT family pseudopilin [Pseudomonas putida]MEB2871814.1 GspH/FimT family pseudopilin [Pseudomonas rhizosphaerae]